MFAETQVFLEIRCFSTLGCLGAAPGSIGPNHPPSVSSTPASGKAQVAGSKTASEVLPVTKPSLPATRTSQRKRKGSVLTGANQVVMESAPKPAQPGSEDAQMAKESESEDEDEEDRKLTAMRERLLNSMAIKKSASLQVSVVSFSSSRFCVLLNAEIFL